MFVTRGDRTTAIIFQYHRNQAVHRGDASVGRMISTVSMPVQGWPGVPPNLLFVRALALA